MSLGKHDYEKWVNVLDKLPNFGELCAEWINGPLKQFFPFEKLYMAHALLVAGQVTVTHHKAYGHCQEFIQHIGQEFDVEKRGALIWWIQNRQPFFIDPNSPRPFVSTFEIDEIRLFGLENIAAHGVLNLRANAGTYFSFSGVSELLSDWHMSALRIMAPVLNDIFLSEIGSDNVDSALLRQLSARQRMIVRFVAAGQDDKTIACELGISLQTVKNQMSSIYQKLHVKTRSQLINLLR